MTNLCNVKISVPYIYSVRNIIFIISKKGKQLIMFITEIFKSIDGEGTRAGEPAIFVRFAGCNLKCAYCDTGFSKSRDDKDPQYKDQYAVVEAIHKLLVTNSMNNITITGGEPMMHSSDILLILNALYEMYPMFQYSINIETNGTYNPNSWIQQYKETDFAQDPQNDLFFTFDLKTASAGEYEKDLCLDIDSGLPRFTDCLSANNSTTLHSKHHVIKSVVGSVEDLKYVEEIYMKMKKETGRVRCFDWYISPVFGKIEPCEIVEFILSKPELNYMKVQLQLHKIIWPPEQRGV